jgi:NAD(P)-dependent dehydrogenase (short-subunit alcohol dehydrogenase family)
LVTAGPAGIGHEIARAFGEAGAQESVFDADEDSLVALAREIPACRPPSANMSRRADIERAVPAAVKALGGLDVLLNNAGISGPIAPASCYRATGSTLTQI